MEGLEALRAKLLVLREDEGGRRSVALCVARGRARGGGPRACGGARRSGDARNHCEEHNREVLEPLRKTNRRL